MTEEAKECPVCDIASALAVAKGICNTFREKGLDCSEFLKELENQDGQASDAVKALLEMRDKCQLPEAKEMLDYITKASQLDSMEFTRTETPTEKVEEPTS